MMPNWVISLLELLKMDFLIVEVEIAALMWFIWLKRKRNG